MILNIVPKIQAVLVAANPADSLAEIESVLDGTGWVCEMATWENGDYIKIYRSWYPSSFEYGDPGMYFLFNAGMNSVSMAYPADIENYFNIVSQQ